MAQTEQLETKTWRNVAGAWLGVGTAPGALLVGAGLASRHGGVVPLLNVLFSAALMFLILWFQGMLGLVPPLGDGVNLTELTPRYFGKAMQRIVGAVIAIGMTGWFGFNVGLGGAALSALLKMPPWLGPVLISVPILILSLRGLQQWNGLAAMTTVAVLALVVIVVAKLAAPGIPIKLSFDDPLLLITDSAVFIGYISVFSIRSPDFTAGLGKRRDLLIVDLLLCVPVMLIALAGVNLQRGTGTNDLVGILAQPGGLAIGNLLITLAVIAPTFTTLYSGAPGLRAVTGLKIKTGMVLITIVGLFLAITRFDLLLLSWLSSLAALLPPLIIPFGVESSHRRRGHEPRLVPLWTWLPGSITALILMVLDIQIAPLIGLSIAVVVTAVWSLKGSK
ncbi:MAG: hypothetical protein J7L73_01120 [Anaerolineales bacterium]|nr:hypothetical protein [Anaerolineales bacterium]